MTDADKPLYAFVSHIDGKNARVEIWPDRLEWERKAVSGGKVALGVMTMGLSVIGTGLRGKNTEMIPIKQITSVTAKKGIGFNTEMFVNTAGGRIAFRANHKEAETAKDLIQRLMVWDGGSGAPAAAAAPAEPAAAPVDHVDQLQKLKGLLDDGVLTQEEYDAKKGEILARM